MYEEEVKVEKGRINGFKYSHASYGMIHVSRQTCGGGGTELFGSGLRSNTQMSIVIEKGEVTQDLGRNWYFGLQNICEVLMSPVQYAEMISNPNTQGVPCTIRYTQEYGHIQFKGMSSQTEYIEEVIKEDFVNIKEKTNELANQFSAILSQKGTIKKDDKKALMNLIDKLVQGINSNLPFMEESFNKSIERTKLEAKTEIESYLQNAINRVGLKALQNPEALALVFKD